MAPQRLLLLALVLSTTATVHALPRHVDVVLKPRVAHEECFRLQPRQRVQYRFDAGAPVEFNLHYHVQREAVYPLKSESVTQQQGDFVAVVEQEYCLMWVSRASGDVKLGYEFVVLEPGLTKQ